jgi:hypothetical protein
VFLSILLLLATFALLVPAARAQAEVDRTKLNAGSVDPEDAEESSAWEFGLRVRNLMAYDRFDKLEGIADSARASKARFLGGPWKLWVFYQALSRVRDRGSTPTEASWENYIARVNRWVAAKPDSITARLVLADVYGQYAWQARGQDRAVSAESRKVFEERSAKQLAVLNDAAKLSAKCPRYYETMQDLALAQGWDRARADKLLQEAMAFEPGYYPYYLRHAAYLLERWYGAPGEAMRFAGQISNQLGGLQGAFVYFQIATMAALSPKDIPRQDLPWEPLQGLSWKKLKQGYDATAQLYGASKHDMNVTAKMAVLAQDEEAAQRLFALIGNDYDLAVWGTKAAFDQATGALPSAAVEKPGKPAQ